MELVETGIDGCWLVQGDLRRDVRGSFLKIFHRPEFEALGLRTDWAEDYVSYSERDVLRGMHFQSPPHDHAKLVYCLAGEVLDVVLDLRVGSPTYGQARSATLSINRATALYIPSGVAHGFVSVSDRALMLYKVTSVHAPAHDHGIAWDSFGFNWLVSEPIMSDRDRAFPALADFSSPFTFAADVAA